MRGAVYEPPVEGLPLVAVFIDERNNVYAARAVATRQEGEALVYDILSEAATEAGTTFEAERRKAK